MKNLSYSEVKNQKSFTLIELIIVIGILAILAVVVILTINPAEFLKQSRDSSRMTELKTINKSLGIYQADGKTSFGSSNTVYVSIPDSSPTCANLGLPSLPTGWEYRCSNSDNYRKVDSTGWVPINFTSVSFGASLNTLPIDPVNTTSTGNYYTYVVGGSWKLTTLMESEKYAKNMNKDGGPDPGVYEIGTDLSLANFARGLVGYWKFDEGSGTAAGDSSGYGNNGTVYSSSTPAATWASGQVNGALSFDGTNNYVSVPASSGSLDIDSNPVTLEAWIKPTSVAGGIKEIVGRGTTFSNGYGINLNGDRINLGYHGGGNFNSNTALTTGTWYHVVGIIKGANSQIYINGILDSASASVSVTPSSNNVIIGASNGGTAYFFYGLIDEVRIYNRALSAAEIAAIYNATK